jgi:ABC-type transport system involved in cytochrome bd biosynthesis fused ATPase/permease subunit
LSIVNGEFSWNKDASQPTLEDINLTVKKGELIAILGRVGCGKVEKAVFFNDFYLLTVSTD